MHYYSCRIGLCAKHFFVDRHEFLSSVRVTAGGGHEASSARGCRRDPAAVGGLNQLQRAPRPVRVPTVLSTGEVERLLAAMEPGSVAHLMAGVLYGTGMRVAECCTLRVRDVDFDRKQIVVRAAKGNKDRVV